VPINEQITLKKLEILLAFMRRKNLARVAEEFAQSTVSIHRALHSLEDGLGCRLFRQEGRSLAPTDAARLFAEHARRAVDECQEGIRLVQALAGLDAGRMRIGSLYSLTLNCIPQLIVGLKLRKPELEVDLTMGSNQELLERLADGRLDAAIIGIDGDMPGGALVQVTLFEDQMFLAAPCDSGYARRAAVDLTELRAEKFLRLGAGFVTTESFQHAFALAGFEPAVAMQVDDIFSLINLVGAGMGYALLPGRVASFSPRVRLIPLASPAVAPQRVTLLYPRAREHDPNLLALTAECRMYSQCGASAGSAG
jgi:LysR family malonate utilization transcriptional regulator